jgi:predicted TIM-barrel fold metal-dependent hydrolase
MSLTADLHQHVIPDFYWEASNEDGNAAGGITPPRWSLDAAIAYLDEAMIDVAVPSISTPGVHFGDDAAARTLARRVNEYLADLKRRRPDRFGGFAALPLPDVDGSLEQIEYAFDVLDLDGVSLMTNADGSYLGDSRFDPIFTELQRRAAVVFVHPTASPDPIAHTLGLPDALLDYPVDTSRAIAKLHYSNTFARTPDIKYLFSHAGGTIPFVASRFAIVDAMTSSRARRSAGRSPTRPHGCTGTPPRRSATPCSTCCDQSRGSEMSCSGPTTPIRTTTSRSLASVSFRTPLSLTTASAAAFWVGRPLGLSRAWFPLLLGDG